MVQFFIERIPATHHLWDKLKTQQEKLGPEYFTPAQTLLISKRKPYITTLQMRCLLTAQQDKKPTSL